MVFLIFHMNCVAAMVVRDGSTLSKHSIEVSQVPDYHKSLADYTLEFGDWEPTKKVSRIAQLFSKPSSDPSLKKDIVENWLPENARKKWKAHDFTFTPKNEIAAFKAYDFILEKHKADNAAFLDKSKLLYDPEMYAQSLLDSKTLLNGELRELFRIEFLGSYALLSGAEDAYTYNVKMFFVKFDAWKTRKDEHYPVLEAKRLLYEKKEELRDAEIEDLFNHS